MRKSIVIAAGALAVLSAGTFVATASAQAPLPAGYWGTATTPQPPLPGTPAMVRTQPSPAARPTGVGLIEVYNGPRRTVSYVAPDLSPGEQAALHEMARAENESAYSDELLALKRSYVDSELLLEPYRRFIQQQLFGFSTSSTYGGYVAGGYYPNVGWSGGYGYGWGGGPSYFGGATTSVSRSLANGVGYEGPVKDAMARQIATDASPERSQYSARATEAAYARVGGSERLAKAFGLTRSGVVPAAAPNMSRVILTLKGGDKVEGNLAGEDGDWFRVETATGTVSVRKAEVSRVEMPKK